MVLDTRIDVSESYNQDSHQSRRGINKRVRSLTMKLLLIISNKNGALNTL
jgi:hypothetical protein